MNVLGEPIDEAGPIAPKEKTSGELYSLRDVAFKKRNLAEQVNSS